ncbi:MAG: sodium-independent anion transporter, partial [Leptolyngbyaceae cyanobacterium CAN_BIN12]|nr:sodium-independent anion transporter [Leptolyngbyaceae cyanobacterium CAN_BIN12]
MQSPLKSRSNRSTPIAWLQQEFHPSRLIPSLTAALIIGVVEVIYAISFVALIFSGILSPYISTGVGLSLFAAMVLILVIALMSSAPGIAASIQEAPVAIMGIMARAIAVQIPASAAATETFSTVIAALILTTLFTGICCFLLGKFKLGNLIRFIPYPVTGGFLAGTGWLLFVGAFSFMTDLPVGFDQLPQLFQQPILLQWLPGCCFGILTLVVLRRYSHILLMPGMVAGAIVLFYLALFLTHTSIAEAQTSGLLLDAVPAEGLWHPLQPSILLQANWQLIFAQTGNMVAVVLITVLSLLLNVTGIELAIGRDLDLN